MSDERLNYAELAKILRVRPMTIRTWTQHGLPYVPTGGKRYYNLAEVEAWLREMEAAKQRAKRERKPPPRLQPRFGKTPGEVAA